MCIHAFYCTDLKDPDIYVWDKWMLATKAHPAGTVHKDGMWLRQWLDSKGVTYAKISHKMVNPRDIAGECRRRRRKLCLSHEWLQTMPSCQLLILRDFSLCRISGERAKRQDDGKMTKGRAWNSSWKRGFLRKWKSKIAEKYFFCGKKSTSILFFLWKLRWWICECKLKVQNWYLSWILVC